jgi:hypothetical protein
MSIREKIGGWRHATARFALAGAVAIGLSATVKPREAQANHRWVGPAVAGLVIGGLIGHHLHRSGSYYSTHYATPYPYAYPKRKYRRVAHRHYHPHPPVVYGYAAPYPYYYHYPRPGLSISIYPRW